MVDTVYELCARSCYQLNDIHTQFCRFKCSVFVFTNNVLTTHSMFIHCSHTSVFLNVISQFKSEDCVQVCPY